MTLVLVVEDSPTIASFATTSLHLGGFEVRQRIEDFPELLNPADPDWADVDVLLCDLMLPDTDGALIIATARIHHPHIRRILFTAASTAKAAAAVHEGAIVLFKPATPDEVQAAARGEQPRKYRR